MIVTRHVARTTRVAGRAGFTLMEVLVVVAILVILAGVGSVAVFGYLDSAKEDTARLAIGTIENAASAYNLKHGEFPQSLLVLTQPEGNSPAMLGEKDIIDPWNNPYNYEPGRTTTTGKPIITATAPSGKLISNQN